jgi:hypothetical protein
LSSSRSRVGALASRFLSLWVLCRRRHNTHYADVRIMPISMTDVRLTAVSAAIMSA